MEKVPVGALSTESEPTLEAKVRTDPYMMKVATSERQSVQQNATGYHEMSLNDQSRFLTS